MNDKLTAQSSCDVVIVGEYYCDLIFHDLHKSPNLGQEVQAQKFDMIPGGAYTPALSLKRLGIDSCWACFLGNDHFSDIIRDEAKKSGIDNRLFTKIDRPLRRVTSVFSMQSDRGFLTFIDGPDPAVDVDALLGMKPKFILIQGMNALLENLVLVHRAREAGIEVLSDCGHIETTIEDADIKAAISSLDYFLPSFAEARQLTGQSDIAKALLDLSELCPKLVIKNGADGAAGFDNGQPFHIPTKKVDVVDPTGAGDSFNAGFVYGLATGKSFKDAIILGNLNGSLSTKDLGGKAVPDEAKLIAEFNEFSKGVA